MIGQGRGREARQPADRGRVQGGRRGRSRDRGGRLLDDAGGAAATAARPRCKGVPVTPSSEGPRLNRLAACGGRGLSSLHAAGWSSLVARRAHNPKVAGSNPAPATTYKCSSEALSESSGRAFLLPRMPELLHFFYTFQSDGLVVGGTGGYRTALVTVVEAERWSRRPRRSSAQGSTFERMARTLSGAAPDAHRMPRVQAVSAAGRPFLQPREKGIRHARNRHEEGQPLVRGRLRRH